MHHKLTILHLMRLDGPLTALIPLCSQSPNFNTLLIYHKIKILCNLTQMAFHTELE